ncbi:MAG: hypothetical protein U9N06_05460 [candidate division WOR-3 bacterium]|nr:hypothetical protein [candidate division WOR-3 bacterium]
MLNIIWNKKSIKDEFGEKGAQKLKNAFNSVKGEIFDTTPDLVSEIVANSKKDSSFLIIGGDHLFPFYKAENPTRDGDDIIWTDNFYASTDDDPLLPERPIGRLPDGGDLDFLIEKIHSIHYPENDEIRRDETFGLSAAVWVESSRNVYRVISKRKLLASPPESTHSIGIDGRTDMFYFNLHGSDKTNKWYGQGNGKYPIALAPENIPELGKAIVFTEACYGAYTIQKSISDSIALTFLKRGVRYFVGSTTIAYGPPVPPPTEADLIGALFFKEIVKGEKVGNALLNAKVKFFKEMIDKQGFLDGNDRKTLLQFVLYGNPEGRLI